MAVLPRKWQGKVHLRPCFLWRTLKQVCAPGESQLSAKVAGKIMHLKEAAEEPVYQETCFYENTELSPSSNPHEHSFSDSFMHCSLSETGIPQSYILYPFVFLPCDSPGGSHPFIG